MFVGWQEQGMRKNAKSNPSPVVKQLPIIWKPWVLWMSWEYYKGIQGLSVCAVQKLVWLNCSLCNTGVGFGTHRRFTYWWAWWHRVRMRTCNMKTLFVWEWGRDNLMILLRWRAPGDVLFSFFSFFSLSPGPSCDRPVIETPGGPAVFLLLCDTVANPDLASVASLEQHGDVERAHLDFKVSWHIWFPHSLLLRY